MFLRWSGIDLNIFIGANDKMTFRELFGEKEFKEIFCEIECFTNEKLKRYVEDIEERELQKGSKEIFDAVWGNVEFSNGEIYILDSPLLQRLRNIKQLGLAYFVYCGSDYSRFYHTIGVVYLTDRMVTAINRCKLEISEKQKRYFKIVARLAAIFHDAGHMFFSHVSEHYFSKSARYPGYQRVYDMLSELERKAHKKIALHELFSCMIVNTDICKRLLKCIIPFLDDDLGVVTSSQVDEMVEYISAFIAGVPTDRAVLPYSSIINGPIDADKCDYLSRDSHVTRVPVAVDISRITQKLSVVETKDINMSSLWHDDGDGGTSYYELAMKDSAEKALFQLCIARTIMFDSVYYHHKVLTAETSFRSIIDQLAHMESPIFVSFEEILNYTDGDFNYYFFQQLKEQRGENDVRCIGQIWSELQGIYERELAKRIVCLTPDFLEGKQGDKERLYDDILTVIDSTREADFIKGVKEEYAEVCKLLKNEDKDIEDIDVFVIQAPTNIFGHTKIQVPIDLRNGNQRDFKGYELVSSRETSSSASYIVTREKDRLLILLALQMVLFREYNIRLKEEAITCGKFEKKAVSEKTMQLFQKGYYDDLPQLLPDKILFNYITKHRIEKLMKKYSAYEGPKGYKLSEERIKAFFKQILSCCKNKKDCDNIIDGVFILLEQALFMNREYIAEHLQSLVDNIKPEQDRLYVIPLGSLQDSAKHMMYFWNDIDTLRGKIETEKNLDEVLKIPEVSQIVFFDDGSFSGTQMVSIMQEYLGMRTKTKEQHVQELPEDLKKTLLTKKIVFFFIAFNRSLEEKMKNELSELGIQNIQFIAVEDMSEKWLDDKKDLFRSEAQRKHVKDFLEEIGYKILKSDKMQENGYKEGWSEERVRMSALGYNDAQQMVFLKSSVPTYTITAFWKKGKYRNMIWEPLLPRTEK